MLLSFFIFFALFTGVGLASYFYKKSTVDDYLLASRNTPSWLVGLSYGATISSGATFIGFAGLAYASGITAFYATFFITLGDYIGWRIAGTKVREISEAKKTQTYPSLVGKMTGQDYPWVTIITSVMTVLFLGAYCSAQMVAGAKVGQQIFNWDFNYFVIGGAAVLLAYCWSGGIRASIWTDAVQAVIIFVSLLILIISGILHLGGLNGFVSALNQLPENFLNPLQWSMLPIAIGWLFFGISVLGQPQLMVRHMVAKSNSCIHQARRIYITWRAAVLTLSCVSGLIARILIPEAANFDAELSIPQLWMDLLPPVLVGLLIAGLFSATMSTADSLLLASSSALTQHIVPQWRNSYMLARLGTVLVIGLVVIIALFAQKGVLALVILAWGGLASSVAPLMTVQLFGFKPSQRLAVAMMGAGLLTAAVWRYGLGSPFGLMELVPGMLVGFAAFAIGYTFERKSRVPQVA